MTGATGRLGRLVVTSLHQAGHRVRRMSSRPGPDTVHGDLATGEGLASALAGVEAVDRQSLQHLVYVSIVGVDRTPYSYYHAKFAAEQVLLASAPPVTMLRVTQFHEFVDDLLPRGRRGPVLAVPSGWQVRPVAVSEAAQHVRTVLGESPAAQVREFAGPKQLESVALARQWAGAQHPAPRVVPVPVPGKLGKAFHGGSALSAGRECGVVTYAEHLAAVQPMATRPARLTG